jgi:TnpA family transposase
MLGYRFSPRLADITDVRFWRFAMDADYGALDGVSHHRIDRALIIAHWDDILRIIGSLKMGRIPSDEVISMVGGSKPTPLGRALMEVGRIAKTAFLLRYINDEQYRRRIQIQLNRGETRHRLARAVYHGRKGEMRQPYREGMEEQLGALGLVVNIIVLWNSLYLDRAVAELRERGLEVLREDIERLSPLGYDHIHLQGHYPFTLADYILQGDFLPLREIDDQEWSDVEQQTSV